MYTSVIIDLEDLNRSDIRLNIPQCSGTRNFVVRWYVPKFSDFSSVQSCLQSSEDQLESRMNSDLKNASHFDK